MELLKQFASFFVFLVGYYIGGIFVATACAMVAGVLLLCFDYYKNHNVDKMQVISLVLILGLGGLTLILKDDRFIKLKPTLLNLCFGAVFLGSVMLKRPLLETLLKKQITLPHALYQKLSLAWGLFFLILSLVNIWVAQTFTTETWVYYKVFGQMGLMVVFVILQSIFLSRMLNDGQN